MGYLYREMEKDLKLRGLSLNTQAVYLGCCTRFAAYYMRSPAEMGETEVRDYLVHLVEDKKISAATHQTYAAALKFLYRVTLKRPLDVLRVPVPKRPKKIPDILTGGELEHLLSCVKSVKYRALVMLAYGAGLRIDEACGLGPKDIDSAAGVIHVRLGKGGKDRLVMLSERLLAMLREYWKMARPQGPYLFPGQRPGTHISDSTVRYVLRQAVKDAGITKRVTPHVLRHCFATHLLQTGTDILTIQKLLGHCSLGTTTRYIHGNAAAVNSTKSPLDLIGTDKGRPLR